MFQSLKCSLWLWLWLLRLLWRCSYVAGGMAMVDAGQGDTLDTLCAWYRMVRIGYLEGTADAGRMCSRWQLDRLYRRRYLPCTCGQQDILSCRMPCIQIRCRHRRRYQNGIGSVDRERWGKRCTGLCLWSRRNFRIELRLPYIEGTVCMCLQLCCLHHSSTIQRRSQFGKSTPRRSLNLNIVLLGMAYRSLVFWCFHLSSTIQRCSHSG